MKLYINGSPVTTLYDANGYSTNGISNVTMVANTDPLKVGGPDWSRYFSGRIDEVRVWNVVRTVA
jgi:hypothetical protein